MQHSAWRGGIHANRAGGNTEGVLMTETMKSTGGRVRVCLSWGLLCVLSTDRWRRVLTPGTTLNSATYMHMCVYRSLCPSCPVSSDRCPVPAGQGLSSCCLSCSREVAVGHDVWLHAHSHACASAVTQDSSICCVLLFLFFGKWIGDHMDRKKSLWQLSVPVGMHILHRFISKFDFLYAELLVARFCW